MVEAFVQSNLYGGTFWVQRLPSWNFFIMEKHLGYYKFTLKPWMIDLYIVSRWHLPVFRCALLVFYHTGVFFFLNVFFIEMSPLRVSCSIHGDNVSTNSTRIFRGPDLIQDGDRDIFQFCLYTQWWALIFVKWYLYLWRCFKCKYFL